MMNIYTYLFQKEKVGNHSTSFPLTVLLKKLTLGLLFFVIVTTSFAQQKDAINNNSLSPISSMAEKKISQFLATDQPSKVPTAFKTGDHLRSTNGLPMFNLDGTPVLKQAPSSSSYKKGGTGGINALGYNNEVTIQKVDATTGKPYLIVTDLATYKTISSTRKTN